MAMFPSSQSPDPQQSAPVHSSGVSISQKKKRGGGMLDQILAANRGQSAQNVSMMRLGGPGYLDYMNQLRSDPMNSFF